MTNPVVIKDRTQSWGRRFGSYLNYKAKNAQDVWGNCFVLPKGGKSKGEHSGPSGRRTTRWYQARNLPDAVKTRLAVERRRIAQEIVNVDARKER